MLELLNRPVGGLRHKFLCWVLSWQCCDAGRIWTRNGPNCGTLADDASDELLQQSNVTKIYRLCFNVFVTRRCTRVEAVMDPSIVPIESLHMASQNLSTQTSVQFAIVWLQFQWQFMAQT